MTTSPGPESASPDKRIHDEQVRIDRMDGAVDRKLRTGGNDESEAVNQELTNTYFHHVDDLRGYIRDLRRKAEAQKDMRAPHWQALTTACDKAEQGLLDELKKVNTQTYLRGRQAFSASIDRFIGDLWQSEAEAGTKTETAWDGGERLRELTRERAKLQDIVHDLQEKGRKLEEENKARVDALIRHTDRKAPTEEITNDIRELKRIAGKVEENSIELRRAQTASMGIELDLLSRQVEAERKAGHGDLADRLLLRAGEEFNASVIRMFNPLLGEDYDRTRERLMENDQLSRFDRQLLEGSNHALDTAVAQYGSLNRFADIMDQLNSRFALQIGEIKSPADLNTDPSDGKLKTSVDIVDASGNPTNLPFFTTLRTIDGRKIQVSLTPEAAKVLREKKEKGESVFLLKNIPDGQDLKFETWTTLHPREGAWNRFWGLKEAHMEFRVLQDCRIAASDLATSKDGKIFDATGREITDRERILRGRERESMSRSFVAQTFFPPGGRDVFPKLIFPGNQWEVVTHGADMFLRRGSEYRHLRTIRTAAGRTIAGVAFTEAADALIDKPPPPGMTLVLRREPRDIQYGAKKVEQKGIYTKETYPIEYLDTIDVADLAYAKSDGAGLTIQGCDGKAGEKADIGKLQKDQEERGRDILRALDRDPSISSVCALAGKLSPTLTTLQRILVASMESGKPGSLVDYARDQAAPLFKEIQSSETKANLARARESLSVLKKTTLGVALGGLEKEIDARTKALDEFQKMLADPAVLNVFETITDVSKFHADRGWEGFWNWCQYEGPKVLAGIVIAAIATYLVIQTFGAAAPIVAVLGKGGAVALAGFLAIPAGMAGFMVGYGGAAEAQYALRNACLKGTGLHFGDRTQLGRWLAGQRVYDPETNTYVSLEFGKDVLTPALQEFAMSTVMCFASIGLAGYVAGTINKLLTGTKAGVWLMERLSKLPIIGKVLEHLRAVENVAANTTEEVRSFLRYVGKDAWNQVKFQSQQKLSEEGLAKIDRSFGQFAALLVMTIHGIRPLPGRQIITVPHEQLALAKGWAKESGHTFTEGAGGSVHVTVRRGGVNHEVVFQAKPAEPESGPRTKGEKDMLAAEKSVTPREKLERTSKATEHNDKESYEEPRRSESESEHAEFPRVENVAAEYGVTFIHGMWGDYVPANSRLRLDGTANFETRLLINLGLSPELSVSSSCQGDNSLNRWSSRGIILAGGHIQNACSSDNNSVANRGGTRSSSTNSFFRSDPLGATRAAIVERGNRNEFIVRDIEIAGLFFAADDARQLSLTHEARETIEIGGKYQIPVYCLFRGEPYRFTVNEASYVVLGEKMTQEGLVSAKPRITPEMRARYRSEVINRQPFNPLWKPDPFSSDEIPEAVWMSDGERGRSFYAILESLQHPESVGTQSTYQLLPGEKVGPSNPVKQGMPIRMAGKFEIGGNVHEYFVAEGKVFCRISTGAGVQTFQIVPETARGIFGGFETVEQYFEKTRSMIRDGGYALLKISCELLGFAREAERSGNHLLAQQAREIAKGTGKMSPEEFNEIYERRMKNGKFAMTSEEMGLQANVLDKGM